MKWMTGILFLFLVLPVQADPTITGAPQHLADGQILYLYGAEFTYMGGIVEIGDADTRGACTTISQQTHSLWVDNAIHLQAVDLSGFPVGQTAYLYVTPNADTPSNGYPMVVVDRPVVSGVTGTLASGQALTITGMDFGAKAAPAPLKIEDFEWGSDDTSLDGDANGGLNTYWSTRAADPFPKPDMNISTTQARTGKRSAAAVLTSADPWTSSRNDKAWKNGVGFAATGKVYISYWQYIDWGTAIDNPAQGDNYQFKLLYLGDYDDGAADMDLGCYPIIWQHQDYASGSGYNWSYLTVHTVSGNNTANLYHGPDYTGGHDTIGRTPGWYHIVIQADNGSPGLADGRVQMWISSPAGDTYSFADRAAVDLIASMGDRYDAVRIGWYRGSTSYGETTHYYDDIYMDNTFSRIELGDAPTYDACRHRELLPPTTWTGQHVTATVNTGTFTDGEEVYLFVVNDIGVPSVGYGPISVSSTITDSPEADDSPSSSGSGGCFVQAITKH